MKKYVYTEKHKSYLIRKASEMDTETLREFLKSYILAYDSFFKRSLTEKEKYDRARIYYSLLEFSRRKNSNIERIKLELLKSVLKSVLKAKK